MAKSRSWSAKTFTDVCESLKAAAEKLPWPACPQCPVTEDPGDPPSMTTEPISQAREALGAVLRDYRVNKPSAAKQIGKLLDSTEAKLREYLRDAKSRCDELELLSGDNQDEPVFGVTHDDAMAQAQAETQGKARAAITVLVDALEVCAETAADNDQSLAQLRRGNQVDMVEPNGEEIILHYAQSFGIKPKLIPLLTFLFGNPSASDRQAARFAHVSPTTVGKYRKQWKGFLGANPRSKEEAESRQRALRGRADTVDPQDLHHTGR